MKLPLQESPDFTVPFGSILSPPPSPFHLPSLKPEESGVEPSLLEAS